MTTHFATIAFSLLAAILPLKAAADSPGSRLVILEPERAAEFVTVENVTVNGNRVSGVIVNRGPHPLRDFRLVIGHVYRWPSEFHPAEESPNQAQTLVVSEEVPAGGRTTFSTTFGQPEPPEMGGSFVTNVYVVGFEEVLPPPVAARGRNP